MKKALVVIGSQYGDEGKGLTTDWLCRESQEAEGRLAVCRFNGGAQAAHTVVHDGKRNVFHHIGSGTLQGVPTILSKYMSISPFIFLNECYEINEKFNKKIPEIFVDPLCNIITPYDVAYNQTIEKSRGDKNHGSCGMGYGASIERSNFVYFSVDSAQKGFTDKKMKDISAYYYNLMFDMDESFKETYRETLKEIKPYFDIEEMLSCVNVMEDYFALRMFDTVIFEGAQGLYLDQNSIDFPHVTRSNTGLKNLESLVENDIPVDVFYVSRTYTSRHGAGPLDNEIKNHNVKDLTNQYNEFQEGLRVAPINMQRLETEIKKDLSRSNLNIEKKYMMVTHCDSPLEGQDYKDVIDKILSMNIFDKIYKCYNPEGKNIKNY